MARFLVFMASGAVLVLEILAGRLLAPVVGVTLETFTGIIGVVLAGISFGAWYGGVLADRHDPRQMLPIVFMLGGATAIAAVPLIRAFSPAATGGGASSIVFLAGVAFFVPSAVSSAAPPMVVKLRLDSVSQTGAVVGKLSAVSTAGSLCGVFLTGFVLIGRVPTTPIVIGTGGLMVAIGLVLRFRFGTGRRDQVAACLMAAIGASAIAVVAPGPCEVETEYYCARVLDDADHPTGRLLMLDDQRHSYIDLADPRHLEFSYTQILGDVIDVMAPATDSLDVIHVGGGGFTMPRYVRATRPGSTSLVLELDPGLVGLAEDELGLVLGDDITVLTGDARVGMRSVPGADAGSGADLVVGDAFGGEAVPWHLTTREFLASVKAVMRDDAFYAVNLIDRPPLDFVRAEVATLMDAFAYVAVIAPADRLAGKVGGNIVVVAGDVPLPVDAIRAANRARGDDDVVLDDRSGLERFVGRARVLTDEFAPVDQLITTD